MVNHGSEQRLTRRIIAEDNEWTLQTVPYLRTLSINVIVSNWSDFPYIAELPSQKERSTVMSRLDLNLDLNLALLVGCDDYWKRRALIRWPIVNISDYGNSYKRLFFEKHFEETIEQFVPDRNDVEELEKVVSLVKNQVVRVKLSQLLPPIPRIEDIPDEDEEDDDVSHDHVDLAPILKPLPKLIELDLQVRVNDVGMNFEWGFFTVRADHDTAIEL